MQIIINKVRIGNKKKKLKERELPIMLASMIRLTQIKMIQ